MIVISDTGPLNDLIRLEAAEVLPALYETVTVPDAVRQEMLHPHAPEAVQAWAARLPTWAVLRQPQSLLPLALDAGERAAISLAVEVCADLVLIDERCGRQEAQAQNLKTIGTLGILVDAARSDLLNLTDALARLQRMGFHVSEALIQTVLAAQASE